MYLKSLRMVCGSQRSLKWAVAAVAVCCLLLICPVSGLVAESVPQEVRIAVLALRGNANTLKTWQATADYLNARIPGYRFRIIPYDFKTIGPAAQRGDYDFVIANSSIYIELEALYGVTRIATLQGLSPGRTATLFGGVIFCRTDRNDITTVSDLRGKTFGAVEQNSFGGWRMAWREFHAARIDPFRDFRQLEFIGTHDGVVQAVQERKIDAGTARSGILENMAKEGTINLADFKIIHQQHHDQFNLLHSTRLYPEWPFARLRQTNDNLAQKVSIALLSMQPEDKAAQTAGIHGWTTPHDYTDVHELFKELKIGPYRDYGMITLAMVLRQYLYPIIAGLVFVLLLVLFAVFMLRLNDRLNRTTRELEKALTELGEAQSQIYQKEKMASIGQLAAGVAHEINNPMGFITSNLGALDKYVGRLTEYISAVDQALQQCDDATVDIPVQEARKRLKIDRILDDAHQLIAESQDGAERVRRIVQDLKSFSRVDQAETALVDLNESLETTINMAWNELKYVAELQRDFGDIPEVRCFPQQLNQVFLNLLVNAAHALGETRGVITVKTEQEGAWVLVSVSDTGCGMSEEVQRRIFEPFFTTKEVGKGTGLGLSISYDIIKKHGGTLEVASDLGRGSTFMVRLPTERSADE